MKVKNILISQNAPEDIERSPYAELLRKYSINLDFYKFFKINCTTAIEFRKTHINILDYESIVFSSTNTIDKFFELCKDMRVEMPESMKYFCATESIALYLQKYVPYRKRRVFSAKDAQVSSFYDLLIKNKTVSMLIPCSHGQSRRTGHRRGRMDPPRDGPLQRAHLSHRGFRRLLEGICQPPPLSTHSPKHAA